VSAFIDERKQDFGVEPVCRTLDVSASAYYQRATGERSARDVEDERLLEVIRTRHKANYEAYGARRMWKDLRREGEDVGRDRVRRLMRRNGIQGAKRRGRPWRTTTSDATATRRPDLIQRQFTAIGPDLKWVADFTYLRCWEGVAFFSFVLDVFSRMLVGWQFAAHMRDSLVLDALEMAVGQRQPETRGLLVHHSDQGSQYTSGDFTLALAAHGLLGSVGSVGDAYDNAMAESLVDTLKTELIADRVWRTRSQLEFAIAEWVGWYNNRRLHGELADIPPVEFELAHTQATPALLGSADLDETPLRAARLDRGCESPETSSPHTMI
jgi:transposase InsO family protein